MTFELFGPHGSAGAAHDRCTWLQVRPSGLIQNVVCPSVYTFANNGKVLPHWQFIIRRFAAVANTVPDQRRIGVHKSGTDQFTGPV